MTRGRRSEKKNTSPRQFEISADNEDPSKLPKMMAGNIPGDKELSAGTGGEGDKMQ